jgi:hypothetical protein
VSDVACSLRFLFRSSLVWIFVEGVFCFVALEAFVVFDVAIVVDEDTARYLKVRVYRK